MQSVVTYIRNPKKLLSAMVVKLNWLFPDALYLKIRYYLYFGKRLNLKAPKTFSEKIQWLKLYNRKPEYTMMVDKYAVKKYVKSIIGEKYIIPTLGVWNSFDDIDFDSLPDKFVLKTTNGGGSTGVLLCKNKRSFNKGKARQILELSLKRNIYDTFREWPYKNVHPQILAEELLEFPDNTDLYDYKFFCFNGEPQYCQVISGRNDVMSIDFFDKSWIHQPFHEPKDYPFAQTEPAKPVRYELMVSLARQLAKDIPFVRIDFYNLNGNMYFGEITFFPTSGFGGFMPEKWDEKFGEMIEIDANLWKR